jgi:hypothetical protein
MPLSRGAVRQVLRSATDQVPQIERPERAMPYREQILELYQRCKGNLVRVHEELLAAGAQLSYPALTAFCRRQGMGQERKSPVGEYRFTPGQEMQHDTSPHRVEIGGHLRLVQTASLVLCYSRMLFFEFFPTFTRFDCKVFLTDALMEERYRRKPTILTTNLEYDRWHQLLGNKDLTDALLSRLRHQCQTIRINGPSLREPQA